MYRTYTCIIGIAKVDCCKNNILRFSSRLSCIVVCVRFSKDKVRLVRSDISSDSSQIISEYVVKQMQKSQVNKTLEEKVILKLFNLESIDDFN